MKEKTVAFLSSNLLSARQGEELWKVKKPFCRVIDPVPEVYCSHDSYYIIIERS